MASRNSVTKLPKLDGAEYFINWKRRVKAYSQQLNIKLIECQEPL